MTEKDSEFLAMFKDPVFVSIPKSGGSVFHTLNLQKVLDRNSGHDKMGAYFTVNGFAQFQEGDVRGRTKDKVTTFNASFLDIDLTPESRRVEAEAVYKGLSDTELKPTAVVLTGKGLHVYWVYKKAEKASAYRLKEYEVLQSAIVSHFESRGADRQARDAARVLRVPGCAYWDGKGEKTADIELLYFNPEMKYEPVELARYFKDSIQIGSKEGEALLNREAEFDLSTIYAVKKGGRHHMAYSAALSLIQRAKSMADARALFNAAIGTWDSPQSDPLNVLDCWAQFDNAVKMLEKDRPQLFIGEGGATIIKLRSFEDIEEERLEWLWDSFLAKGKSHLLSGMPGLGKSQLTVDIAARLSTGEPFPSYTLGNKMREPIGTIILSAEDGAADTIRPRLRAAGADLKMVFSMPSAKLTRSKNGKLAMSGIALKEDAEALLEAIATLPFKVGLIVVDPVSAFMSGDADGNSNSDVRGMLAQLQAVVMDKGVAMLMINHLNKNVGAKSAHMRALGSTAWTAVARATFYVAEDRSEPGRLVFAADKTNLAKKEGHGFFYRIAEKRLKVAGEDQGVPFIDWDPMNFPTKPIEEYMGEPMKAGPKGDECEEELELFMAGQGDMKAKDVLEHMKERGFPQATVYRAARRLGIITAEHGVWRSGKFI